MRQRQKRWLQFRLQPHPWPLAVGELNCFQVSYVVKDATGQALARVYARETRFRTARSGLKTAMCFWNRYSLVRA